MERENWLDRKIAGEISLREKAKILKTQMLREGRKLMGRPFLLGTADKRLGLEIPSSVDEGYQLFAL